MDWRTFRWRLLFTVAVSLAAFPTGAPAQKSGDTAPTGAATLTNASALLTQASARLAAAEKLQAASLLGQALAICRCVERPDSRDVMIIPEQRASVLDDLDRTADVVPLY